MWNAEGKMRNGNCGRWCGTVGKMCNAEICLCGRSFVESIVNSCEWACCILVVRFNCIKSEYVFVIDVPQVIFLKCRIYRLAFYVGLGLEYYPVTDRRRRSLLYRLTGFAIKRYINLVEMCYHRSTCRSKIFHVWSSGQSPRRKNHCF